MIETRSMEQGNEREKSETESGDSRGKSISRKVNEESTEVSKFQKQT